jgi:hypothetical protein
MLNHGAGHTSYAPTTVLQQYLLDGKLCDIDIALQVRSRQLFEILYRVFRKRFREEDARVIDDTSMEPRVSIAVEAISRAVEGSPMSPRTTASRSVAAKVDAVMFSELPTTL